MWGTMPVSNSKGHLRLKIGPYRTVHDRTSDLYQPNSIRWSPSVPGLLKFEPSKVHKMPLAEIMNQGSWWLIFFYSVNSPVRIRLKSLFQNESFSFVSILLATTVREKQKKIMKKKRWVYTNFLSMVKSNFLFWDPAPFLETKSKNVAIVTRHRNHHSGNWIQTKVPIFVSESCFHDIPRFGFRFQVLPIRVKLS